MNIDITPIIQLIFIVVITNIILSVIKKFKTPIYKSCGSPMVKRTAKRVANAGNEFWGCSTYPKCRNILKI